MKLRHLLIAAIAASFPATAPAQEIVIGLNTVMSGVLKTVGETTVTAVDLAVDEINQKGGIGGRKIKLIKFDTGSDPKQAATGTQKFAQDDKALAIIGPFSSGEAAVAFPVGERLGIVEIPNAASTPGLTKGFSYAWRLTADEGTQFTRLLKTLGNVAPQVTQALERKPDVVAIAGTPDSAGKVIKELRRQGFKGRVIGSQIFADPNSLDLFGRDADGMIIVAGYWWDRNEATRAFTKKFGEENVKRGLAVKKIPHHTDAQAYDIVFLLKQAMEKAGVTGDPAKLAQERTAIRDALQGIRFTGITGENTCFNADRDARLPGFVIEINEMKWNLFDSWPADTCQ
jgi:branched-chain amino acid transport system substrate-binding protein